MSVWRSISIDFNLSFSVVFHCWHILTPLILKKKSFILFAAAKQSAVSDVERCFDEARELVRENLLYCVKIDGNPITISSN